MTLSGIDGMIERWIDDGEQGEGGMERLIERWMHD